METRTYRRRVSEGAIGSLIRLFHSSKSCSVPPRVTRPHCGSPSPQCSTTPYTDTDTAPLFLIIEIHTHH